MKIFFRRALQLVAGLRLGRHQANNCICRTKPKYKAPSSDIEGASARSMHNIRDILPGHYREISRTNYFSIAKKQYISYNDCHFFDESYSSCFIQSIPCFSFILPTMSMYCSLASSQPRPFLLFQASHFAQPLKKRHEKICSRDVALLT